MKLYQDGLSKKEAQEMGIQKKHLTSQVKRTVKDKKVQSAMEKVDRAWFMNNIDTAYKDVPQHIGKGQTISQPTTVGLMLELADLKPKHKVLEAGAGSGWNAALIAYIVYPGKVLSIEKEKELVAVAVANTQKAKARLKRLDNLSIRLGDVYDETDRYDRIIFTAGIEKQEEERIDGFAQEHLLPGGKMICPFQSGPLIIIKKAKKTLKKEYTKEKFSFVPLKQERLPKLSKR
jgi:protein-L-isoaspartate(D-aspartate) O-methyltransferase